jgi:ABC-2 type transport system permease protein
VTTLDAPSTTGSARDPAAVSPWRTGSARTVVELKTFFREKDAVIFIFAFPLIMLAIFATVFGGDGGAVFDDDGGPGVPFTQYFLPGMIAAGIMLSSFQALAISIAMERDDGTLKRLRGTPMPPVSYFVGKIGQVLITSLAQIALLLAFAALVFDVQLPSDPSQWLTFGWIFALGTAAGTVLGIGFSSVPRSGRSASAVVSPMVIVLQFISGVFFVFNDLPTWMQRIASLFPLKWMAQGLRSVFLPPEMESTEVSGSWQHGATALVLSAWLLVGLVLCIRGFRWTRRDAG